MFDDPTTTLVKMSTNEAKTKRAVLLQSDGNATVDFALHVSVMDFEDTLLGKEIGNTFTADRNHGATEIDSSSINLNWICNDTLQIDYDKKLRTFLQKNKVDQVKIIYIPR
ncbi:MAG TPA: hypothetical protein VF691_17050 [Cytophagaceae bacterium]